MNKEANLIVLSDLHVGDRRTMERNKAHRASCADQFEHLINYYLEHRIDGLAWRLVMAGDFIDFVEVVALPDEDELEGSGIKLNSERRRFGLRSGPWESVWKLRCIMRDNQEIFRALARFVMDGNDLFIVSGNHDVFWYWPDVRNGFLEGLARLAADDGKDFNEVLEHIKDHVRFNPWFYYEEGDIWVEHGNQFDPYNSFEFVTIPLHPRKNEMAPTIGTMAQRYFTNRVHDINPYAENIVSFFDYFRWLINTQKWDAFKVAWFYLEMAVRMVLLSGRLRRRKRYVEQLKSEYRLGRILGMSRRKFRMIRRLHKRPLLRSWRLTAAYVSLDKMLLLIFYLLAILLLVFRSDSIVEAVVTSLVMVTSMYGVINLLGLGQRRLTRERFFLTGARVGEIAGVKNVVLGHKHEPYMGSMGDRVRVYGLGAWISNLGGVNAGLANAVIPSYVVVTGPSGNRRVVMHTWDGMEKKPSDGKELSRMQILAA